MHCAFKTEAHNHTLFVYKTKFERFIQIAGYIVHNLLQGYKTVVFVDTASTTMLEYFIEYLSLSDYVNNSRVLINSVETFIESERFCQDEALELLHYHTEESVRANIPHMAVIFDFGDSLPVLLSDNRFLELEQKLNAFYKNKPATGLCAYCFDYLDTNQIEMLQQLHDHCYLSDKVLTYVWGDGQKRQNSSLVSLEEAVKTVLFRHVCTHPNGSYLMDGTLPITERSKLPIATAIPNFLTTNKDVIWVFDSQFIITYASPAVDGLFNQHPDFFVKKPIESVFGAHTRNMIQNIVSEQNPTKSHFRVKHTVSLPKTKHKTLDTLFSALQISHSTAGYIAVSRDISTPVYRTSTALLSAQDQSDSNIFGVSTSNAAVAKQKQRFEKKTDIITKREFEIIRLVMEGLQNREVAERLFIAEITVKKHLSSIYQKLHVRNRVELIQLFKQENRPETDE